MTSVRNDHSTGETRSETTGTPPLLSEERRRRPAAVVWDFDGTIADTFVAIRQAVDDALGQCDLAPGDPLVLRRAIGLPLAAVFAAVTGVADPDVLGDLAVRYRRAFTARLPEQVRLFDGMGDVLEGAARLGVPMAIATSKGGPSITAAVAHLGVEARFAAIVGDDDVDEPKPSAQMLEVVGRRLGVAPAAMVMIGDAVVDVEMGRRAHATTIAVTWGNQDRPVLEAAGPDFVVDAVPDLGPLLARLLGP